MSRKGTCSKYIALTFSLKFLKFFIHLITHIVITIPHNNNNKLTPGPYVYVSEPSLYIYIGKQNIMDENSQIISHDWRSPICSMFYDFGIEDAYYNAFSAVFKSFYKEIQINTTAVASGLMGNITCLTCH